METAVILALIGLPVQLILAWATLKKASRADKAVNHRVTKTTISQDIQDMKAQQAQMQVDLIFLQRMVNHIWRSLDRE